MMHWQSRCDVTIYILLQIKALIRECWITPGMVWVFIRCSDVLLLRYRTVQNDNGLSLPGLMYYAFKGSVWKFNASAMNIALISLLITS